MIDIHTHILPGIDDGARHWRDSYEMAALAADSGVETIVCTHHANIPGIFDNYNSRFLDELFLEFQDRLEEGEFPVQILRGMEIYATEDVIGRIMRHQLISLNHSGIYLIEFGFDEDPAFIKEIVRNMIEYCGTPLIAHPERYYCVQDRPELIKELLEMGALTQVNKGSILGRFGHIEAQTGKWMLEENLATCLASDAHGSDYRTTDMELLRNWVVSHYSEEKADLLLKENPSLILEGKAPKMVF